jgi:ssDNA-binding Zn-finger/Zn-ribbon topoisomerase 1
MGIRCSLLGHDYGESFVERDREERGNEVVVTERELQECQRCGAEKVTSENTEVRSLDPEPDVGGASDTPDVPTENDAGADAAGGETASEAGGASDETDDSFTSATEVIEQAENGTVDDDADEDGDDAVILDSEADDETPGSDQWDEPADPEVDPEEPETPTPDPEEEDVEFVESGPSDTASDPAEDPDTVPGDATTAAAAGETATEQSGGGQPPAADEATVDRNRGEWPDHDGEDEGFDAQQADDAADDAAFEFGGESEAAAAGDAAGGAVEETQFTSAGPVETADTDDLDYALYCPECGFERYAAGSSLRAGDICPECKRGYLAEDR